MMDFSPHQATTSTPVMGSEMHQLADQAFGANNNNNNTATDAFAQLSSIFDVLDLEGNGDLDFPEFKVGLNSIGVNLTHDEAITLFESIDAENELYINKESFLEWLSRDNTSPQIDAIRNKLTNALNAAQEINNPIQDMMDEDDIYNILGNKEEYKNEMEQIKKHKSDDITINNGDNNNDNDDLNESDGTTKINNSSDDDFEDETDSMDSAERREIEKAKIKQQKRDSKKYKNKNKIIDDDDDNNDDNDNDNDDDENIENMETSLMEQEMNKMREQQKYALDRTISGRNTINEENASKWQPDEIDHEYNAMNKHYRRLSQASLSIDQVQQEANKTMEEFRKISTTTPVGDDINDKQYQFTENVTTNTKQTQKKESLTNDTVGIPSTIDDDYDMVLDVMNNNINNINNNNKPTINDKQLPLKKKSNNNNNIHEDKIDDDIKPKIDIPSSPITDITNTNTMSVSSPIQDITNTNTMSVSSPIQEIANTGTPHTTSTQPIMIGGGSQNNSRRNSYSYSYSHSHHQQQQQQQHAAYVVAPHQGMTDISQFTAIQPMQQQLINNNGINNNNMNNMNNINNNSSLNNNKNPLLRLFRWYISPMHSKDTLHRLWYHGANAVLSAIICFIMLSLFVMAIGFIPFCGIGLIFLYFQCLLARHFAIIDSTFSLYFFGNKIFPRFSIFIPKSHEQSIIGALKEYIFDPHMIEVILYFTFIKLPAAFILSGITMVIFSGVTSILLSPLIFWLDPEYFRHDRYCIFGSKQIDENNENNIICNGWAVNSFGETFLAFLVFIPCLPLTLHLSNFSAKLLCKITLNFLSTSSSTNSPKQQQQKQQQQQQQQQQQSLTNNPYSLNGNHSVMINSAGYR